MGPQQGPKGGPKDPTEGHMKPSDREGFQQAMHQLLDRCTLQIARGTTEGLRLVQEGKLDIQGSTIHVLANTTKVLIDLIEITRRCVDGVEATMLACEIQKGQIDALSREVMNP